MSRLGKENNILLEVTRDKMFSIKEKLNIFYDNTQSLKDVLATEADVLDRFYQDLDTVNEKITDRPHVIHRQAVNNCEEKEEQINKHLTHQKAENSRMHNELDNLKSDHGEIYKLLEECKAKLDSLEDTIGRDIPIETN